MRYVKGGEAKGRRKCPFSTKAGSPRPAFVDYKDVVSLRKFLNHQGKLRSRKQTGVSAVYQRALSVAVKRARFMGLLPYTGDS
jgi:small subunit ribosomal protein S18